MPESSLIEYIKKTRQLGIPDEVVKEKLLQAGWPYERIIEAFNGSNGYDNRIKVISKKYLSKLTLVALLVSFLIPPLGMALAYFAMQRLKKDDSKIGHEFLTASFVVGAIGTVSVGYIIFSMMGYMTGVSNITGYFTKECFFSKNFKCLNDAQEIDNTVKIELRNDINSPIDINDAIINCDGSRLVDIYPDNIINPNERFSLVMSCQENVYDSLAINYTVLRTQKTVVFEGKI